MGKDDLTTWLTQSFSPRVIMLWLSVSVLVGYVGPFGTFDAMPTLPRLIYWTFVLGGAIPVAKVCRRTLRPSLGKMERWPRGMVVSLALATIYAPAVVLFNDAVVVAFWQIDMPLGAVWIAVYLSSLLESVTWRVFIDPIARSAEGRRPDEDAAPCRLLNRIEPDLRGDIVSLSVRDHYVEVTTDRGQVSLLMRFADALDELEGVRGLRVHRSHWIAVTAILAIDRIAGRLFVRLRDGRSLPVSRSYQDAVLALGLPLRDGSGKETGEDPSRTARPSGPIRAASAGSVQGSPPV